MELIKGYGTEKYVLGTCEPALNDNEKWVQEATAKVCDLRFCEIGDFLDKLVCLK